MPSLFCFFYTVYMDINMRCPRLFMSKFNAEVTVHKKKGPRSNLSKERKSKIGRVHHFFFIFSFFVFFFFKTLAYFNKKNKHEHRCEVVVIRSAGLVVPNSRVSHSQSLARRSTLVAWETSVLIIIYIIIMWLLWDWPVSVTLFFFFWFVCFVGGFFSPSVVRKTVEKK